MNKIVLVSCLAVLPAFSYEPSKALNDYLSELKIEAKKVNPNFKEFDATKGKDIFFTTNIVDGKKISCVSCHSDNLSKSGQNIKTNKVIDPLSPSANKSRLSEIKDMKKWLRRNFNDVYKREGTAQEKGDVLLFISKD
jgi:cytochrome c peroxidase